MRLDEIDQPIKKAVFTFGRMNPPHYGHGGVIKTLQTVAKQEGANWYLFLSSKVEPEKNPLTYEQKCYWVKILFPETAGHLVEDASIKNPLIAATWLYKQGFRQVTFVAGEDDMESYANMIKSGNEHGRKNPDAVRMGKGFYFDKLDFAISPRLTTATKSRESVTNNDPESFARNILGGKVTNPKLLAAVEKQLFPMVRKGMQLESINEDADEDERHAFMMRPENQKDTSISNALKNYTPLGDLGKIGSAVNKGDLKGAIMPAAQLATNLIPGKAAATAASTAIGIGRGLTDESEELNKRTPSVREIAKKHMTDPSEVHRQIARGVKVEFEHTNDIEVATEIAMDHIGERLDYYARLAKVEEEDDDAVAIPGEPVSAAMDRMNARPDDQSKADFLGSYMKSALGQGGFTDDRFAKGVGLKKKIGEEKKPKKPRTIIDGALKTLIAKGRSEDEAIADLKKEIDSKFYELDESLNETLKKVDGKWALVSRKNPKKVLQYYHGSGHPSKDWVSKVERRVHSFESIMEDESVKPLVYLDMDGVLADFFNEWARLAKVDHYKDINDPEENLQLVRDHPTFWVDLPLLPHARDLVKLVIEQYGEYRICSKPLEGDARSKPGKMAWIKKHLSDMMPVEVVLTANKAQVATHNGAPNILVDDFGVNINSFKAAGGIGIKYDDSAFPQVAKILTSIAKSGVVK